jgi:DNA-binding CsgD family transcriptional regulator
MFCDTSGRISYVNERFAKYINQPSAAAINGKLLSEIYPDQAAAERLAIIRRSANERRPLVVESVWNGVAYQTILRPLSLVGGDPNAVACIVRHQPRPSVDDVPASVERIHMRSNNLGPLSTLTMRELELLALIGEGLSSQDIAKKISRSIKTVEAHRASLGKKLGVASRVALARIAAESNLHFDQLQSRQVVRGRLGERTVPPTTGN